MVKGSQVRVNFSPCKEFLSYANSADIDVMPLSEAFHLGLYCLSKNSFKFSIIQRVNLFVSDW